MNGIAFEKEKLREDNDNIYQCYHVYEDDNDEKDHDDVYHDGNSKAQATWWALILLWNSSEVPILTFCLKSNRSYA